MKSKILSTLTFLMIFGWECFSVNIDKRRNPQIDAYIQKVYIHTSNTINRFFREKEPGTDKGQTLLHLSFPYINSFHFTPLHENLKNNTGFMGYSIGADYVYSANQYVSLSISKIMDYSIPVAFVDKWNDYELMSSDYLISLSNNHRINRFSVGYGFCFSKNNWEIINHSWDANSSTREPVKKTNGALGFIFSSNFQASKHFYLGLIYRPTFFRPDINPAFKYEHSISIDFAWKIPLKK